MFEGPVVYVDIETTGGSSRTSRILEFAAIRVEGAKVVDSFMTLINPGSPIPYHITNLTGIRNADVIDAPFFEDVSQPIHDILSGAIFIAHHVRFDYSFLKRQLEVCNISFKPRMLCSVRLSRALYPLERGHGLDAIIKRFDIPVNARHRAYDDAEAIWRFLQIAHDQHGPENFAAAVNKQLKRRNLPPNVDIKQFESIPKNTGVYTFSDKSGTPIYIGKSVNLRKRILSHFAQDTAMDKEMKLSLHTHDISYIETASELEALLLESQMIKERLPLYNRQLRLVKKMYVMRAQANQDGYISCSIDLVSRKDIHPDKATYGVYSSKMKATRNLENLQKTYDLCPKLLGLEKARVACFKYQLGKCQGACRGIEECDSYNARFEAAFDHERIDEWPYDEPVVLTHHESPLPKRLVLDNWNVIGEINSDEGCEPHYKPWQYVFDIDTYRIIRSYLANKSSALKLQPISRTELEALS